MATAVGMVKSDISILKCFIKIRGAVDTCGEFRLFTPINHTHSSLTECAV